MSFVSLAAATAGAAHSASFPILSALVLLPIIGAVLVVLTSNRRPEYVKLIATLFSVGVAGMSI